MREFDELAFRYLNDDATREECEQLFEWIRQSDTNAQSFARLCSLHAQLREQLQGEQDVSKSGELLVVRTVPVFTNVRASRFRWKAAAIALVVVLACSLFVFVSQNGDKVADQPKNEEIATFAVIAQAIDVEWDTDTANEVGDRLPAHVLRFKKGIVRLLFDDGVEVTVQGAAEYELIEPGSTKLTSGILTATVPPGAEGFRVDTPTAEVIDLGTAFGIELDENGAANVSVFDGEVEVAHRKTGTKQRLNEGESVRLSNDQPIKVAPIDDKVYEKLWPVSSGIAGSTGAFRLTPPWQRLRRIESDTDIVVVPEGYPKTLEQPLKVNATAAGTYRSIEELNPAEIPAGMRVRSFLLQFNPVDTGATQRPRPGQRKGHRKRPPPRDIRRIVGEITFHHEVLGLIVLADELQSSDLVFFHRAKPGPQRARGLELAGNRVRDIIELSSDRKTVTLKLGAVGRLRDHVRIIVEDPVPEHLQARNEKEKRQDVE